jgi:hypothetical protein
MKTMYLAVGALALAASVAQASPPFIDGGFTPPPFQGGGGSSDSSSSAKSTAISSSSAVGVGVGVGIGQGGTASAAGYGGQGGTASAAGYGGQGGSASATGGNSSAYSEASNNSQTVNIAAPAANQRLTTRQEGTVRIANTPDATVVVPGATVPCFATYGANVSTPGLGIGFGGGLVDQDCTAREDARTLVSMGLTDEAVLRLCQRPDMRVALGSRCPQPVVASRPQRPAEPVLTSTRSTGPFGY